MNGHAFCPFCESPVMKGGVEFGDSILHDECFAKLQTEMDEDEVSVAVEIVSTPFLENREDGQEVA
jgi:hypothetical protein